MLRLFVLFASAPPAVLDDPAPLRAALTAQQPDEPQAPGVDPRGLVATLPGAEAVAVRLGAGRHLPVILHRAPLPEAIARRTVEAPQVPLDTRHDLRTARAHAEIAMVDEAGRGSTPLERLEALYRVALALLEVAGPEEGLGLVNPQTWAAYHRRALLPAFAEPEAWQRLREEAMPAELAVGFLTVHDGQHTWCTTRGMDALELPELAYRPEPEESPARARTIFNSVFHYMLASGGARALGAGHTMELTSKKGARMRFVAPTPAHGPVVQALGQGALVIELNAEPKE